MSPNFTSKETEEERVSSKQKECSLRESGVGEWGARKRTKTNKGAMGRVKTWESWADVLFECPLVTYDGQTKLM